MPIAIMLDEGDFDTKESAQLFVREEFPLRAIGKDAARAHHDDPVDFWEDVSKVVRDHEDAGPLLPDTPQSFAELALSGKIEGIRRLVKQKHLRLMHQSAGDHDPALLAGGHLSYHAQREVRRLHEIESGLRALPHFPRDVEIRPEGGGGEESSGDDVQAGGDRRALPRQLGRDDAEVGAELRNIPAIAAEEAQLRRGRDNGITLAGERFDQRRLAAAIGTEDGDVFAVLDAEGEVVQDDVFAASDGNVAHEEEVGFIGGMLVHLSDYCKERRQIEFESNRSNEARALMMPDDAATHLNLWKKHLGAIPAEVWNKTGLEALILADKDLTEVSEAVGRLKKLLMLDLGHNRLTGLPDTIGDLERLTGFLYLHDNQLASLPRTFERLKRLRYLNLSENLFEELPEVACARKDWSSSVRRTSES